MTKIVPITLFTCTLLWSKNFYIPEQIVLKEGIAYGVKYGKKIDGVVQEFFEGGELASEKIYKGGVIVDMKTYKQSGALSSHTIFKNGKAIGGKIYYENPKKDRAMTNADFHRLKLEY